MSSPANGRTSAAEATGATRADRAGTRIVSDEDVVIQGHDLVIVADDGREIARLDQQGTLTLVGFARLDRFGLALLDQDGGSAVTARTRVLDNAPPTVPTARETGDVGLPDNNPYGPDATLRVGTVGNDGHLELVDADDRLAVQVHATGARMVVGVADNGGDLVVVDGEGREVVTLTSGTAGLTVGAEGNEGDVTVFGHDGRQAIRLDGGNATLTVGVVGGNEGDLAVLDGDGRDAFRVDGGDGQVTIGGPNRPGELRVRDLFGHDSLRFTGADGMLRVGGEGQEGDLVVRDVVGRDVIRMNGEDGHLIVGVEGNEGDIIVRDDAGVDRIELNGNTGDIKLLGADLAEDFDVTSDLRPGAVVVAVGPDEVAESTAACDRRVVGVVSGAGDLQPALRLATRPGGRRAPVALVGRVYCQADAGPGPIAIGDLLTTSERPGHAMRVDGAGPRPGTVFGKALGPLADGTGLVPVLLMAR